jgi:hypothetical protein
LWNDKILQRDLAWWPYIKIVIWKLPNTQKYLNMRWSKFSPCQN